MDLKQRGMGEGEEERFRTWGGTAVGEKFSQQRPATRSKINHLPAKIFVDGGTSTFFFSCWWVAADSWFVPPLVGWFPAAKPYLGLAPLALPRLPLRRLVSVAHRPPKNGILPPPKAKSPTAQASCAYLESGR